MDEDTPAQLRAKVKWLEGELDALRERHRRALSELERFRTKVDAQFLLIRRLKNRLGEPWK